MEFRTRYLYSPTGNTFYETSELPLYEAAGTLAADLIEVADSVFEEFTQHVPPRGKTRVPGPDGMPIWVESPPPTDAETRASNEALRTYLLRMAGERIAPLADAAELGMATSDENMALAAWRRFRVELRRMEELPGYPLEVVWPRQPE